MYIFCLFLCTRLNDSTNCHLSNGSHLHRQAAAFYLIWIDYQPVSRIWAGIPSLFVI